MNATELVRRLDDVGIQLTLAGDRIRYRSDGSPPPPELLAEMKAQRAALVSVLERREALRWPPARDATETCREGPLSWSQRTVWATSFFYDDGTYNLSGGLRLLGGLDQAALAAAVDDAVRRHPSLRTIFTSPNGAPVQRILSAVEPILVLRDFTRYPDRKALDACLSECYERATGALALDRTPPVRAHLYRLAQDDHVVFVVLHHLIADGVSIQLLMADLARCYSARVSGEPLPPSADDVDMIDYARFEEEYLLCADLASTRRYATGLLRGAMLGPLPLPQRRDRPSSTTNGGAFAGVVDAVTTAAVRRTAVASRSTPFAVVSTAIAIMLSRFTGREDLIVGMPVARRDRAGLEHLVGLLLDMIPVRLHVRGGRTFLDAIRNTRTAILGAVDNAAVPIELAAAGNHPGRDAGNTLFNVVLTDNNAQVGVLDFRGLHAHSVDVPAPGVKFDLNFLVRDAGDTLQVDVEFDRRILDTADVAAMVAMARRVLSEGVADPARLACDLAMTPAAPDTSSPSTAATSFETSLFDRLTTVAAAQGDSVAIRNGSVTITYRALHHRAGRIARGLGQLGCRQQDVVAIDLPRGIDLIAAMLGIMGSGAACLVLNDAWPRARVDQVLGDAHVNLTIAAESDAGRHRITVSEIEDIGSTAAQPDAVPSSAIAYLIYTSGSAGRPKGVQVPHANVLNLIDGTDPRFGFCASDVWTLFHSCSFDFSIWEIFGCLLTGGTLVVVPQLVTWEPAAFVELLQQQRVTVLNLTPSALSATMASLARDPSALQDVRYLIFGGEALPLQLVQRWYRDVGSKTQLVNMYGITETTVHASWQWLEAGQESVEIGEALPGTSLHVLYDNGRPVDDRCVGEIYVGGAGVALGYLGQPRETALRFVPDPFAPRPGARMYRSGDVARRTGTTLSYLGRRDGQVQLNGFRVELSEVEAALAAQPGVAAAAAAMATDGTGASIVAIVVADRDAALSPTDLVRHVRAVLPRYMVPSLVTVAPHLPLTVNGKLDRAGVLAAATANGSASNADQHDQQPFTPAEALLLELYRDVLHDSSVSLASDFFECGGDSMRAIRLVTTAATRGLTFGVRDVYAAPALQDLAARAVLRDPQAVGQDRAPFSLLPPDAALTFDDTVQDAYPMTALQLGMMYLKERAPASGIYHIVLSYRINGRMDADTFRAATQAVTDRHPVLRTSFDMAHASGPLQRVHLPVAAPVTIHDRRHLDEAAQQAWIAELVEHERQTEFDVTCPGLFRLVVVTLSDRDYQLVFAHHHAILDGWSVNVFFDDLHARYEEALAHPSQPPASRLPHVFADYVALERAAVDEPAHLDFWLARTSIDAALIAPGRTNPPVMRQVRVELRQGTIEALRATAARLDVPIKALLLAAHVQVIAGLTRRREVVTGTVVNCRPETSESDRALGLFLNEYPLRVRLDGGTWADVIQEVHAEEQAMMPHRWYPHALIQQYHGPRPIFDTYFNFTDFHGTRRLLAEGRFDVLDVNEIESTHYALGANYTVDVRSGRLRLIIEYDASALDGETAGGVAAAHERALAAIVANPHAACSASSVDNVDLVRGSEVFTGRTAARDSVNEPATTASRDPIATHPRSMPRTALERSISALWAEVLDAHDIDPHTSFFDAGGTSLRAMRLLSRFRALHGPLSMETFMAAPTIAELARALSANPPQTATPSLSADAHRVDTPQHHPLTRTQEHLWQLANYLPGLPLFAVPAALRADGALNYNVLVRTLASLVDRHAALRTRIAITETGPVQTVDPHAVIPCEMLDVSSNGDPTAQCEALMARDLIEPMAFTSSPLARAMVFRLADDQHVIYLNLHHLICDGWSMALLLREAAQIYRDLAARAGVLSWPAAASSAELAGAEIAWAQSQEAAAQRHYWVERLAPPWPSLTAKADSRFGTRDTPGILERLRSASCRRVLPPSVAEPMRAAARAHGTTEFVVILTAFASTLHAWSGEPDIRVATMMANRLRPERESAIGLLANTVILRLHVEPDSSTLALCHHARQVTVAAFERQELPFEDVLASLKDAHPDQDRLGLPFEVMLLMQEEVHEVSVTGDLRWATYTPRGSALGPPVTPTTCDFVLAATPAGGGLVLDLQYLPRTNGAELAQALLDDIAVAVSTTAHTLLGRA